jgi:hypothetical protein
MLMVFYGIVSKPLRHIRRAVYFSTSGHNYFWFAAWYEILSAGVLILVCWLAYTHVPQVHEFFQHFAQNLSIMWNNFTDSFHHVRHQLPASASNVHSPAVMAASWVGSAYAGAGAGSR